MNNDSKNLIPITSFNSRYIQFNFPDLYIGIAEYEEGPTGCTVFHFKDRAKVAIDIQGGGVSSINTPYKLMPIDAICFAGGSIYGLEASTGVSAELYSRKDYSTQWFDIQLVSGAIIYDYGHRDNSIYPDKRLGRRAINHAIPNKFFTGARGAGRSATVGAGFNFTHGEPSGQGGAFKQIDNVRIAVFTVVNSLGAIHDKNGNIIRGNLNKVIGERYPISIKEIEDNLSINNIPYNIPGGNTTLSLLVTNLALDDRELLQMGKQVHSSMSRVIRPFHTLFDGDIFYTVSTGKVLDNRFNSVSLGAIASDLICDAVWNCFE
jgi:6-aminohexanoate-oligomer endohydrolase